MKLRAEVKAEPGYGYRRFLYLLDGKTIGREQKISLDTTALKPGPHTLRVVAYGTGSLRHQVFVEKTIIVEGGSLAPRKLPEKP